MGVHFVIITLTVDGRFFWKLCLNGPTDHSPGFTKSGFCHDYEGADNGHGISNSMGWDHERPLPSIWGAKPEDGRAHSPRVGPGEPKITWIWQAERERESWWKRESRKSKSTSFPLLSDRSHGFRSMAQHEPPFHQADLLGAG